MTASSTLPTTADLAERPPVLVRKEPGILRVVIYARISKLRSGQNSTNTSIQVNECLRELEHIERDRNVKVVIVAIFKEDDRSASKYSKKPRPKWEQAISLVFGNWVDMVMGTEMERITRRPKQMDVLIDAADPEYSENPCDIRWIYLTSDDQYDLTTENGIYRARNAVAHAERESNKTSRRMRDKQEDKAKEGFSHGGRRCFGFKKGNRELDEAEVNILHKMAEYRLKGWGYKDIAYWLNEQGVKTTEGKLWHAITIRNTLRRPRYAPHPLDPTKAIREHKGAEYVAQWPPVFTPEVWEQLQLIAKLGQDKYKDRPKPVKRVLTGLLVCGKCGRPLNGESKRDAKLKPLRPVYVCRVQGDTQRKAGCGGVTIGAEQLEDFVISSVFYRLDTPDLGALLRKDDGASGEKLKQLFEQRTFQERRVQEILDDYAEGEMTREQKNRAKAKADAKLDEINQEIDQVNRNHRAHTLIPVGKKVREAWDANESLSWRQEFLGLTIDRVTIYPGGGKPFYRLRLVESDKVFRLDTSTDRIRIDWAA